MNTQEIEIYVHTKDGDRPQLITVNKEETIENLLRTLFPTNHAEIYVVIEEADEPCHRDHKLSECGIKHGHHIHCHPREIHYTVDTEPQVTGKHKMTPEEIMGNAKIDPQTHYLIRLKGKHEEESYKDDPKKRIHMHECMRFITGSLGPTPVS